VVENLTHEELDSEVMEALADYEKAQKAKGGARSALSAFTEKLSRKPKVNLPVLQRGQRGQQ